MSEIELHLVIENIHTLKQINEWTDKHNWKSLRRLKTNKFYNWLNVMENKIRLFSKS